MQHDSLMLLKPSVMDAWAFLSLTPKYSKPQRKKKILYKMPFKFVICIPIRCCWSTEGGGGSPFGKVRITQISNKELRNIGLALY